MFTGITQGIYAVKRVKRETELIRLGIALPPALCNGLQIGASVAIDGTCLTVTHVNDDEVSFDLISETLSRTTLGDLKPGSLVNVERALRFGDEVGGHLLSGHILGCGTIRSIEESGHRYILSIQCPKEWMRYILPKGYIALNGSSLTIVDTDPTGGFTVHLIPETRRASTLGSKRVGDAINIEIDSQTQAIVDTVERYLSSERSIAF